MKENKLDILQREHVENTDSPSTSKDFTEVRYSGPYVQVGEGYCSRE